MSQQHTDVIRIYHEDYDWIDSHVKPGISRADIIREALKNFLDGRERMRRELLEICDKYANDMTVERKPRHHEGELKDADAEMIGLCRIILLKLVTGDEYPIGPTNRLHELMTAVYEEERKKLTKS